MPSSISAVQKNNMSFLDTVGEGKDKFSMVEAKTEFEKYGKKFLLALGKIANQKKVVASGELLRRSTFRISENGMKMEIIMPDYFDYPNEGVRGVASSKNAPGSPYKYKNYGMNAEGRASIKKYIADGHAKIATVSKNGDKAYGIGRESKHKSLLDIKTDSLIFMIKKYGIKKTGYFTQALNETFKDFEVKMSAAVGRDIVFMIEKKNR